MQDHRESYTQLDEVIDRHRDDPGALMPIMQAAQDMFGCVSIDVQKYIASKLNVPLSDVYGVATFYSQFALAPKGQHIISVCMGTACYVKGSQAVLDKLSELLGVAPGQTTADGKFTLDATRCLGACGLAPVMTVDNDVHGRLTPEDIPVILASYQDG